MGGFDVGIVGGGIHGAAAAFHLATKGMRTVIFERESPGGGPTGRSSSICRAYYTNHFLARCARDSIAMFRRFEEITGVDAAFRETGFLFLHPQDDAAAVRDNVVRLNEIDIAVDLLEPDAIAARFPMFNLDGIAVAAWERHAGHADPAGATTGLFRKALELGAEHRLGRTVEAVLPEDAGGATVVTDDGARTSCDRVLVAAGPWTRPILLTAGIDIPLTVERHAVGTFRWNDAPRAPAHGDLISGYYLRPEGTDLFIAGTLHSAPQVDADDFPEHAADAEMAALAEGMMARVPELDRSSVQGGWASLYDVSPDWQPVIGEVAPGIFVDAGTSGHGFKLAPALGKHVADLIAADDPDPGILDFHPSRFDRNLVLAAGYRDARILG